MAVGGFSKLVAVKIIKRENMKKINRKRKKNTLYFDIFNHMSTLDDTIMWGFKGFPSTDANLARWVLAAEDICFNNLISLPFPTSDTIYIYVDNNNRNLIFSCYLILHTFLGGKEYQEDVPIRHMKWGTASLIVRAPVTPIQLCQLSIMGFKRYSPSYYLTSLCNSLTILYYLL
ncbi:hypothetical protein UlMin_022418 [Ulmus minor]